MASREELRRRGAEVIEHLQHGTNPPRARPLYLASIPGMDHYNGEALWGGVWARPGLDLRLRMVVTLSILSCLQRLPQLRTYLNSALTIGLDPREIREILIQCSVYAGFPTTVNSLELLREVLERRNIEVPPTDVLEVSLDELEDRGRTLWEHLLGGTEPDDAVDAANLLAPDLRHIEIQYVFGEMYHRPGLDLKTRAICAIASLVALRFEDHLGAWLRGGLRAGLSRDELVETLMHSAYYAGFPAATDALVVASRVLAAEAP
jgi:4-carboxymuconolactone decarboxylase